MPLSNAGIVLTKGKGQIWRCAQPDAEAAFALNCCGVTTSIKLDSDSEFPDSMEKQLFKDVRLFPINPFQPAKKTALAAAAAMAQIVDEGGRCVVHCVHGVDRTGLVVAVYRIIYNTALYSLQQIENERRLFGVSPIRGFIDHGIAELIEEIWNETHKAA